MKEKTEIIEITNKKFLNCQQEQCEWNVGWLGGSDWVEESGKGTRICNLGAKAIIERKAMPPAECQQPSTVLELARTEFEL